MKKGYVWLICLAALTGGLLTPAGESRAEERFRMEITSDGKMWTVHQNLPEGKREDGTPVFWYRAGTEYVTGKTSEIRTPGPGEHYYEYDRKGTIPVGKWRAEDTCAYCVAGWTGTEDAGHGIVSGNSYRCGLPYFSGWMAYCADCGGKLLRGNIHMSYEAAASIDSVNADMGYYFLCPCVQPGRSRDTRCGHLEKYWEAAPHKCRGISYNRYRVVYDANSPGAAGTMEPSFHMYNNERIFEGKRITPAGKLSLCTYDRTGEGCLFAGWNTDPSGRGTHYDDGAEILNLTSENYVEGTDSGTIVLYAQWKKSRSVLKIDAGEGSYAGENPVRRAWGSSWRWDEALLTPPAGYRAVFRTGGGQEVAEIRENRFFLGWELAEPAQGELLEDCYLFTGTDGAQDVIRAVYGRTPISLPTPRKEGYSFGGWYLDEACTRLAGYGGEAYLPESDVTMYAKWVELKLTAVSEGFSAGGQGTVRLVWEQPDGWGKSCRLYGKAEGMTDYEQLFQDEKESQESRFDRRFSLTGQTERFTVPSSGFYSLTAEGAQGGNYGSCTGGQGGRVSGVFYLEKGECIDVTVGGQDGYHGGGKGSDFGNGGGCTVIRSDRKGILMIAGGGGGATSARNGLGGGAEKDYSYRSVQSGQAGMAGGGGGSGGGAAGARIIHEHTPEAGCYRDGGFDVLSPEYGFVPVKKEWREEEKDSQGGDVRKNRFFSAGLGGGGQWIPVNGNTAVDLGVWVYGTGAHLLDGGSHIQVWDENGNSLFKATAEQLRREWDSFNRQTVQPAGNGRYEGWPPVANVTIYTDWSKSDPEGDDYDILESYSVTYPVFYENRTARNAVVRLDSNYKNPVFSGDYSSEYYPPENLWRSDILFHRGYGDRPLLFSERSFWWGMSGVHFRYKIDIPEGTGGLYLYAEGMMDELVGYPGEKETQTSSDCEIRFDRVLLQGSRVLECSVRDVDLPAYGGSSYVNAKYAVSVSSAAGVKKGDGSARIRAESAGFAESGGTLRLEIPDLAAPFKVEEETVMLTAAGKNRLEISFQEAPDRGTVYWFRAETFSVSTGEKLCDSNVVPCLMKSGIKGYYYLIDRSEDTELKDLIRQNPGDLFFTEERRISADITEEIRFLHLAAADYAGNLSDALHIRLNAAEIGAAWKIATDTILIGSVEEGDDCGNLYPGEEDITCYVRADGKTPFRLSFSSRMDGPMRRDYQINCQIFEISTEFQTQRHGTVLPDSPDLSLSAELDPSGFLHWSEGSSIMTDASAAGAVRSGGTGTVAFHQAFVLSPDQHGRVITITPSAGAVSGKRAEYSDESEDRNHGIRIVGDGQGPVISGLEGLPGWKLIDREEGSVVLELTAEDGLSGVKEFYLEITNRDNFLTERFRADEEGRLQVSITESDPLFSGDFLITAYASDHVGNETMIQREATEFALIAEVTRILSPHEPVFKRGESGILSVEVWGYAGRLEVVFPEFLSQYNQVFSYERNPQYLKTERIQFMIPLDAEEDVYEITVRAYKEDRRLEEHPSIRMVGVEGSVLDEIRTRLR